MRRKRDAAGEGGRSGRNSGLENLDSRDNAQLLEELDSYLERTDMFSLDLERVDAYLAKMQEREPVGEDYDQPAELERLFAAVEAEEAARAAERKPRRRAGCAGSGGRPPSLRFSFLLWPPVHLVPTQSKLCWNVWKFSS